MAHQRWAKWLRQSGHQSRPTTIRLVSTGTMCRELELMDLLLPLFGIHIFIHPKSRVTMWLFHNKGWPHYDNMQTILGEHSGACGRHAFHPATAAPAPVDVDGIDGRLDALDIDIDIDPSGGSTSGVTHPSDVLDMRSDLMMPPSTLLHQTSATTTSSQSSKCLCTNTLPDSSSGSAPISSFPSTPQSSSLPLSSTLVQSSQLLAPKRAQVSMHGSMQTGISSASKLAAKITPAAAIMNMQEISSFLLTPHQLLLYQA
ncbi:hypothetical protein BD769DRAFT_1394376 [Suillus cothurnatus]|nr:hypothetical protein BD769DRAFT_1394376 [Suillus cothurnatus]